MSRMHLWTCVASYVASRGSYFFIITKIRLFHFLSKTNKNVERSLGEYEERKKKLCTFEYECPSDFYEDDDKYIAAVRAALLRGETLKWFDREAYERRSAEKKCDSILEMFNRLLDPFEMYFLDGNGIPPRVWASMVHECPPGVLRVIQDTCSTFAQFSDWRWHKGDRPPDDWKENRKAIEDDCPFRKALLTHLNDRLMSFCDDFSSDIVKWYKHQAIQRWKKVKAYVDKGALINYWIHIANKPGSTGHLSGIRFVQQT